MGDEEIRRVVITAAFGRTDVSEDQDQAGPENLMTSSWFCLQQIASINLLHG